MRLLFLFTAALCSCIAASVPKVEFEKYTLPNGVQVILHVDRKLPVVHVNQWYYVGSANERPGRTGFAHLFEHMMFQGSKNADKYIPIAEKMGASIFTGGVNGTTNNDRTNYFATVPSGSLEALLWLESDRLLTLPEGMTPQKLDNQRDVVKNERRQGLENEPYGKAFLLIDDNMYPAAHPYQHSVIGSHEDLTAATMDDVKEFFRTYYTPNNLSLVIAGDFDPAEAKRLVAKYFGSIPPGPPLDRPVKWIPRLDSPRVVDTTDRVPQERVYLVWQSPGFFQPGDADLDLLSAILGDGLSSRLNKALVYDAQLCSSVEAMQWSRNLGGLFAVIADARPGVPLSRVGEVIDRELARIIKDGPTQAELDRAKAKWEYQFVTGLERIGGFGGKADLLNQYNVFLGDPNRFEADVARHREVTIAGVRAVAAEWLGTPNRLTLRFHPETSKREPNVALDRSKMPALGADRPFSAPDVKTAKLDNGMQLFVVERHDLPKVAVTLATKAGAVRDPQGRDGLADFTAGTIKFGTATRKALDIEDALGDLGTQVNGHAVAERAVLSMDVLRQNLAPAMAIFSDIVLHPAFPEAELSRERQIHLDELAQESADPGALANRIGPMLVFGAAHPYGHPAHGLPETVRQISREDVQRFHRDYWKPGSSALILAGDISLDEAVRLARQWFGSWSGGAAPAVPIPEPKPVGMGRVYVVDRQDAAQTDIEQLIPGARRSSDDYYALQLADAVWGGGFKTRLNMNLREEKGYSYGVFSRATYYSAAGTWIASGGVQTNKTKESIAEFRKELNALAGDRPITEAELLDAKATRTRSYAQEFESLGRVADHIAQLWALDMPVAKELQREPAELQGTSLTAVNKAAQHYARPANVTTLLIGDWSKIRKGVEELDLGPITVLDTEGRTLAAR